MINLNCLSRDVKRCDIFREVNAHIRTILSHRYFLVAHLLELIINDVLECHINHSFVRNSESGLICLLNPRLVNDFFNSFIKTLE